MIAQIQVRRGTTAEWAAASPVVLATGEPGWDSTLKGMKVGDGSTEWAALPWIDAKNRPDINADTLDGVHLADIRLGQNILHNWDFRNPINQRGVSGTVSASGYFVDRWYKYAAGEIEIASAGLNCGASIEQRIEGTGLAGQTATFSIMIGGVIYAKTLTFPSNTGATTSDIDMPMNVIFGHDTTSMRVRLSAPPAALTYQAVKLELGTVSTLHLDPPMAWAVELPKCYRFYQVVNRLSSIYGHAQSSTLIRATMPLMSQMRIVPTLSHTNIMVYGNGTQILDGAISGLALTSSGLSITITGTGYPSGHVVTGRIGPSSETVFLTADL